VIRSKAEDPRSIIYWLSGLSLDFYLLRDGHRLFLDLFFHLVLLFFLRLLCNQLLLKLILQLLYNLVLLNVFLLQLHDYL